ncbi:glycosyltransferase family 39 protein [Halobaculum sp. CBA1158]|uniref:glycosyltransferase family 39 protein n=1 Tax=Halobaculum sp. CBA1158 TaxID=2904243 RepID=UPI001F1AC27C|nr:glycosyltransferase family 39 protein [Halobaculum sp. CBA1158]UIP01065.1 glycosyltransferase family 39 protein [Halobaculum sp. CBA1158]
MNYKFGQIIDLIERRNGELLLGAVALVGATNLILLLYDIVYALTLSQSIDYAEGFVLNYALNWDAMFQPVETAPHLVTNYPPVYPVIVGILDIIFNNIFFSSRFVSVISGFFVAALSSLLLYRDTDAHSIVALTPGIIFLFSPIVSQRILLARVDILGMTFSIAAIYWFMTRSGRIQLVGSGLLCLLALYTKQSLFVAPAAIVLTLIIRQEFRRATAFSIGLGGVGLGLLGVLTFLTGGEAWLHLVTYNQNTYSLFPVIRKLYSIGQVHLIVFAFAGTAILTMWRALPTVMVAYFIVGSIRILLGGKVGSGPTPYLSMILGAGILAGYFITYWNKELQIGSIRNKVNGRTALVVFLVILQLGAFLSPPVSPYGDAEQADLMIEDGSKVLSEDAGLLIGSNSAINYQPFIMRQLMRQEIVTTDPIINDLDSGEYDYVVLLFNVSHKSEWHTSRWTPEQINAIRDNYKLYAQPDGYWIYKPK